MQETKFTLPEIHDTWGWYGYTQKQYVKMLVFFPTNMLMRERKES
jgi:hypothetical protein